MIPNLHLLTETLQALLKAPGLMSPLGRRLEMVALRDIRLYFTNMGRSIEALELEKLVEQVPEIAGESQAIRAKHFAEMKVEGVTRRWRSVLIHALAVNLQSAYMASAQRPVVIDPVSDARPVKEADTGEEDDPEQQQLDALAKKAQRGSGGLVSSTIIDGVGPTGHQAAEWAAEYSSSLVVGIDNTTRDVLAQAVSDGIENRLGVEGLQRAIRAKLEGFTVSRARTIATTEMNSAMSKAQMDKMKLLSVEYKQLILAPGACDICESIMENGPVPIDEPFVDEDGEEYDFTPIHPSCRCATVGARPPKSQDEEE